MKWPGMSGVGGQEPLIRGPLVACILLLLLLLVQPHHCAHHHPPLTAGTVKLRPERAALTPPTVTSLRPPDKGGNGKHAVGLTARGEQSSSNSPPVVASRSPSSTTYSAYPHHNIQQVTHHHRPTAPIATAASGSRSDAGLNGQRFLTDHQQTSSASTAQSIPAPTLRGIRVSSGTSTASSSYKSAHPSASVNNRNPQYARVSSERAVPEPKEKSQTLNANQSEAEGGWAEMGTEALGGVWEEAGTDVMSRTWSMRDHHPYSSHGRHDTFGHNITEDFTHLENEYAPRTSHGRGADDIYSSFPDIDHSEHNSQTNIYPQEEVVRGNSDRHYPYQQQYEFTDTSRNSFGRVPLSRDPTHNNHQPVHQITSGPYHGGYKPIDYSQQRHIIHEYDQMRNNSHHYNNPFTHTTERKTTKQNTLPTTIIPDRPLSMTEVARLKNMTEIGDLLQFLKRKGITLHQLLNFVNSRPTKQALLNFLDRSDISTTTLSTTTYEPQLSTKSFSESPTYFSLSDEDYEVTVLRKKSHPSTKSRETSNIHLVPESNSDTSFGEGVVNDSIESNASYNQNTRLSTSPEERLEDDEFTKESLTTEDEQKQNRNRNKKRKNRERKRKKKGKKNKRQRGRKGKSKTQPDLVYTTAILPINRDINDTEILGTKLISIPETISTAPPTSTVSMPSKEPSVSTLKSGILDSPTEQSNSPPLSFPNETPVVTLPSEITRKSSFAQSTVPTSLPNSTQINFSLHPPDSSSSSTTLTATLIPKPLPDMSTTTVEMNPLTSTTTPTFMPEEPTSKTSEVSIISFAVVEVPKNETGKSHGDETVPEHSKPMRKRPKHHNPHHDMHGSHNGRFKPPKVMYEPPEHTPAPTPKGTEKEIGRRTNFVPEQHKDDYIFPIKGILIISGVMGALAVFTLVVLISYAVIKCSKKPVVNNYQVSEQKPTA